jgi:hypothetical protein
MVSYQILMTLELLGSLCCKLKFKGIKFKPSFGLMLMWVELIIVSFSRSNAWIIKYIYDLLIEIYGFKFKSSFGLMFIWIIDNSSVFHWKFLGSNQHFVFGWKFLTWWQKNGNANPTKDVFWMDFFLKSSNLDNKFHLVTNIQ